MLELNYVNNGVSDTCIFVTSKQFKKNQFIMQQTIFNLLQYLLTTHFFTRRQSPNFNLVTIHILPDHNRRNLVYKPHTF